MLTQIDINSENAFFVRVVGATAKDSLLVRKITGLSPPDISLFIGDYARDGGIYQGRRVGNRNVVITFDLNPNPALGETVKGLRELLHKSFYDPLAEADFLQLNLHDSEGGVRYLVGYSEKFESEIFEPETMAVISLICPDPYLRDANEVTLNNAGGWTTVPFTYAGTAETGFTANILVNTATSTITLDNNGKQMVINRSFAAGDVIKLNTNRGARSITLLPGGTGAEVSLLPYLTATSKWLELHSQANTMKIYGATTGSVPAGVTQLKYRQAFWGI